MNLFFFLRPTSSSLCMSVFLKMKKRRNFDKMNLQKEDHTMKIGIACDHGAVEYKTEIIAMLVEQGHEVIDCGCDGKESVDYPDYGYKCAKLVQSGEVEKGIVMCGTGIGIGISANKVKGIRCGLCFDTTMARLTREHNDANMLAVGQRTTGIEVVKDIVNTFLTTPFSNGERHIKRIEKLMAIEEMEG